MEDDLKVATILCPEIRTHVVLNFGKPHKVSVWVEGEDLILYYLDGYKHYFMLHRVKSFKQTLSIQDDEDVSGEYIYVDGNCGCEFQKIGKDVIINYR